MAEAPVPQKGVLPKNLQTWVVIGVTIAVLAVIVLPSLLPQPKKKAAAAPEAPTTLATAPQSPTQQVEAALAQMQADQERNQREGQINPALLAQYQNPRVDPYASPSPTDEEEVRKAQARREYTSLFAPQLVRSYRQDRATLVSGPAPTGISGTLQNRDQPIEAPNEGTAAARDPEGQLAKLDRESAELRQLMTTHEASPRPRPAAADVAPGKVDTTARNQVQPEARHYVLLEGTILEAALVTRIAGDFSGPVIAQTTAPTYTRNVQHILIPAGSRIIGEAMRVENLGQARLAVAFHRIVMPDGYSVDLDQFTGLSGAGETALKDQVDNHYRRIFGTSIALGLLGGLGAVGTQYTSPTPLGTFRQGATGQMAQSATQILDKLLNILPTITIREGHRMRVWIAQDIALPTYTAHAMPGDL
jgi:type IV secretory pathway VirB10-like protein